MTAGRVMMGIVSAFPFAALGNVAWIRYAGRRIAEPAMTAGRVMMGIVCAFPVAALANVAWIRCAGRRIAAIAIRDTVAATVIVFRPVKWF